MRFKEVCVSIVGLSELTVGQTILFSLFFFLSVLLSFCHSVGFLMQVMFAFKKIKHKPT